MKEGIGLVEVVVKVFVVSRNHTSFDDCARLGFWLRFDLASLLIELRRW